ncbi:MAG: site-specific integrase [Nitrospirae bacterium]|nr:site-specific integrase [Nitrospirota bacterium]
MNLKGSIRPTSRERNCPSCGQKFDYVPEYGYFCVACQTKPERFYIDLWYRGKNIFVCSDKTGQALDTYDRAHKLQAHITVEIENHAFDPARYSKMQAERFYAKSLLDKFEAFKIDSIAPSYQKDYKRHIKRAKDFFKVRDVREIRKLDLIEYQEYLQKTFELSGKSLKNVLDGFKTFMNYLKSDLEVIDTVPAFPHIETEQKPYKWVNSEDQAKLFAFVPDEHKPIIAFLMLHGCRPSEARALRVKDVDIQNQSITISATFSGRVYREKRKGKRSRSVTVPIHHEMIEYFAGRVRVAFPESYIFINKRGLHYSENSLRRIWEDVRTKAKITNGLRLYDATRHSFASNLINGGASIYKVSRLLGHSSVKMTEKYTHSEVESLRADMHRLSLDPEQSRNKKIVPLKKSNKN